MGLALVTCRVPEGGDVARLNNAIFGLGNYRCICRTCGIAGCRMACKLSDLSERDTTIPFLHRYRKIWWSLSWVVQSKRCKLKSPDMIGVGCPHPLAFACPSWISPGLSKLKGHWTLNFRGSAVGKFLVHVCSTLETGCRIDGELDGDRPDKWLDLICTWNYQLNLNQ